MTTDNQTTIEWICSVTGLTRQWVSQLANQGVFVKTGRGQYLLKESMKSYCAFLVEKAEKNKDAKKRIAELQAEKLQIEVNKLKRVTLDRSEIMDTFAAVMTDLAAITRSKFEHELPQLYRGRTPGECRQMNADAWAEITARAHAQVAEAVGEVVPDLEVPKS
jgi:hypothetical protein